MLLQLVGIIAVIIASVFVFRTARDNGRRAIAWTAAALGVGFGVQFVVPILLATVLAVIFVVGGSRPDELRGRLETPATIITFACLGLSLMGVFLILKHVSKLPEDNEPDAVPPPPQFE